MHRQCSSGVYLLIVFLERDEKDDFPQDCKGVCAFPVKLYKFLFFICSCFFLFVLVLFSFFSLKRRIFAVL